MLASILDLRKNNLVRKSLALMPDSVFLNLTVARLNLPDSLAKDLCEFLVSLSKSYDCKIGELILREDFEADLIDIINRVGNLMKGGEHEGNNHERRYSNRE